MSKNNFINPLSPHKIREIRIWIWLTCIIPLLLFITISGISALQFYLYFSLNHEIETIKDDISSYDIAKQKHLKMKQSNDELQQRINRCNLYKNNPKNPLTIFSAIYPNAGITLQSITIDLKTIEIRFTITTIQTLQQFLRKLSEQKGIQNARLISLEKHQDSMWAIVKGNITNKLRDS